MNNKCVNDEILLEKYKRGIISYEEFNERLSKTDNQNLTLEEKLERKLLKEYSEFIKSLTEKSKYNIIDKSYEITCKDQIKNLLCDIDLDDREIVALLEEQDLLTSFYNDWLDDGFNELSDSIENTVGESIANATKYYYKNKQKSIER